MKNIHVLPTENYKQDYTTMRGEVLEVVRLGQLILNKETNQLSVNKSTQWAASCDTDVLVPHHIYISCDDEEVKDGDWCYYENGDLKGVHKVVNGQRPKTMFLKKIILTTDQELISDGVQPIDDEFLEWFIKNPGCVCISVEVGTYHVKGDISGKLHYKIFTPKEEPKSHIEYTNTDDCTSMIYNPQEAEQLPTKWFKTEQISTWIGKSITRITTEGESIDESKGGHGKLIVMHQCGDNKEELISQLETMIYGLKMGFEDFAN